ncbi:MAG: DNA polymerase III subunit gamma/tau [Lachnospiraceae bacterium]|nr:DNA polymerase III subunit gamma/tau [Lachnospiraceae bacterium]
MSYTALYRKFRPATFSEVKDQDAITETLKNQVKKNRIAHAYIFNGTRGTGKTSVAKILAKAVNCENPVDGSPCLKCSMCKAIETGAAMNVIELDAASNNGVDDVRKIIDEVKYTPSQGKYKVFIVDEVHMLSTPAFNALLKTLEEPPEYVIFILATTELVKIPITILSRCQRYDFKRITNDAIAEHLGELCKKEGIEAEERALRYISVIADGSMRDGLSVLDRILAYLSDNSLTLDLALEVLGTANTELFLRLADVIRKRNAHGLMLQINDIVNKGCDLSQFLMDYTWFLRNLLILKADEGQANTLDVPSIYHKRMIELSKEYESEQLISHIRELSKLSNDLKLTTQKRVMIETTFLKLCMPQTMEDVESMKARIKELERRLDEGEFSVKSQEVVYVNQEKKTDEIVLAPKPKALSEDLIELANRWKEVEKQFNGMLSAYEGKILVSADKDGKLLLVVDTEFLRDLLKNECEEELSRAMENVIGKSVEYKVEVSAEGGGPKFKYSSISELSEMLRFDRVESFEEAEELENSIIMAEINKDAKENENEGSNMVEIPGLVIETVESEDDL